MRHSYAVTLFANTIAAHHVGPSAQKVRKADTPERVPCQIADPIYRLSDLTSPIVRTYA